MPATLWQFDPTHSRVGFAVRHLMVSKVRGEFAKWSGTFAFDPDRPEASTVAVDIDAASLDTKEPQRDAHLRSGDFFDAEHFPTLTFRSTKVERAGAQRFSVAGDLTIRGVTRAVTLDVDYAGQVKDAWGGTRAGFSARTTIDRKEFGLVWNMVLEAGGLTVGDQVEIDIEIEAVRQADVKAA